MKTHKSCTKSQGGRVHAMNRSYKAKCKKSYAVKQHQERHDKQYHAEKKLNGS